MTAMLADPGVITDGTRTQTVHLEREDIWFYDVSPDRVRIEITVRNASGDRSAPTMLRLQAAPLGAFLPWQPLTTLPVPALEPGESIELRTDVSRPRPAPLGDFASVPPRKLLTAVSPGDRPPGATPSTATTLLNILMLRLLSRPRENALADTAKLPEVPPDVFELLGRRNPHWAGNFKVFVGDQGVERHHAPALLVLPGCTNLLTFLVGTDPDAYAFRLEGDGAAWETTLYDGTSRESFLIDRESDPAIRQSVWAETSGCHAMILAICPPEGCRQGNLEVHVTQRSTGKTAIVEFSLDPTAAGPGCYTV